MPQKPAPMYRPDHLPLQKFCEIYGYEPDAIRQRIYRAQWIEGREFHRDPFGHIHISLKGYDRWVRLAS